MLKTAVSSPNADFCYSFVKKEENPLVFSLLVGKYQIFFKAAAAAAPSPEA